MLPDYITCVVIGYLIGSIPFGYLMVKLAKGIDLRTMGSGNIGATNVARVLGVFAGGVCFLLDTIKGFAPTFYVILKPSFLWQNSYIAGIFMGVGVILGHLFPLYLGFRGGKGVACGLGVFLALAPIPCLITLVIWVITFLLLRYVSLASICAAISLAINLWLMDRLGWFSEILEVNKKELFLVRIMGMVISLLVIIRHIPNIKRLLAGAEPKVHFWKKKK